MVVAFTVAACSGASPASPGGSGGEAGSGGGAGTAGSDGGKGGSSGGGGGNTAGSGGATGGSGGARDGGADSGGGLPPLAFLDNCFAGLRKLASTSQLSEHSSSNGAYRVRLAIEWPPGTVGTSGTIAWEAVRVGIITPQKQVCIKDEAALAAAYKGSHHNCSDVLVVMSQGLVFEIKPPDVSPERPVTTLTVTGEGAIPAVMLPNVTCTGTPGGSCGSGGPCK
jgi:hypothetical protein